MPWVRFDDQFTIHRKVDGLSDTAFRLHVAAIFWCARNLTDGFVPEGDLVIVSARLRAPARFAAECVARNLWHTARDRCDSPGCPASARAPEAECFDSASAGWFIHDYFVFQPRRERVLRDREMKAEAGRIGGIASGQTRRSGRKRSKPKAKPKQDASLLVEHPYPYPKGSPQPPASGGHDGSHPNCRACGTSPRGKPPDPLATPMPPPVEDVIAVNGRPLRGAPVKAIADRARQAMSRREPEPEGPP